MHHAPDGQVSRYVRSLLLLATLGALLSGVPSLVSARPNTQAGEAAPAQTGGRISGLYSPYTGSGDTRTTIRVYNAAGQLVESIFVSERSLFPYRYQTMPLPDGSYRIRYEVTAFEPVGNFNISEFYDDEHRPDRAGVVSLQNGQNVSLRPALLEIGSPLRGQVTTAAGAPISGALVEVFDAAGFLAVQTVSDGEGQYHTSGLRPDETYRARVSACSSSGGYLPQAVTLAGRTLDVSLASATATPLYSISGQVRDTSGNALIDAQVAVDGGQSFTTGVDGRYTLRCFPAGSYQVRATKDGFSFATATVTVSGNVTDRDFIGRQGSFSAVTGAVSADVGGPVVGATVTATGGYSTTSGADGSYALSDLPPGVYTIGVSKAGYRFPTTRMVTVPPDQPRIDFAGVLVDLPVGLTIGTLTDELNGQLHPAPAPPPSTVEGNTLTAAVRLVNTSDFVISGTIGFRMEGVDDPDITFPTKGITLDPRESESHRFTFTTDEMAWDQHGFRTNASTLRLRAQFQTDAGSVASSGPVALDVRPRPVVLVHGYDDSAQSWYHYLNSPDLLGRYPDIQAFAVDTLNTNGAGSLLGLTYTMDKNAEELGRYLTSTVRQRAPRAAEVDVVAHSMGGLITRRHLTLSGNTKLPRIDKLIMLGTPNLGTELANAAIAGAHLARLPLAVRRPAIYEITPQSVERFNEVNKYPYEDTFYGIAGNYNCGVQNRVVRTPNDIAVWRGSVFGIKLAGGWTYPSASVGSCAGDHLTMRSPYRESGVAFFRLFVSPLLRGIAPGRPSELAEAAGVAPALATNTPELQLTLPQTRTLAAGGAATFTVTPERGADGAYQFITVGLPGAYTVELRDPSGAVVQPAGRVDLELFSMQALLVNLGAPGAWTVTVRATERTPPGGTRVAVLGGVRSEVALELVGGASPPPGGDATISVRFRSGANVIRGATVRAEILDPSGEMVAATLRDDGQSGDGQRGDGVYGLRLALPEAGTYSAVVSAAGSIDGEAVGRSAVWTGAGATSRTLLALPLIQR